MFVQNSFYSSIKYTKLAYSLYLKYGLSDEKFWYNNKSIAIDLLKRNGYPLALIQNLILSEINKITYFRNSSIVNRIKNDESLYVSCIDESQTSSIVPENKTYVTLTYIKGLSETLKGILGAKFPDKLIVFKYENTIEKQIVQQNKR